MEIKRDIYLKKLISKKRNGLIKVVTGVRRCGKSYLLFNLFKNHLLAEGTDAQHIIEIAFDSFENKHFRAPEVLYPYLKKPVSGDKSSTWPRMDLFVVSLTKPISARWKMEIALLVMYDIMKAQGGASI